MEANKKTLGDIFTGNNVSRIPYFQRSYVWPQEYWERLLEDMLNVSEVNEAYFMGSIIRKEEIDPNEIFKVNNLVDGQQRMTTLFIFFKVLSLVKEEEIFDDKFIAKVRGHTEVSIRHSRLDRPAFDWVMNLTKLDEVPEEFNNSQVTKAYEFIRKELQKEKDKYDIWNIYENLLFVVIDLVHNEDEQQIFDTINSLGIPLSTAELLKNHLFNQNNETEYEQKWYSIFEEDEENREYWEQMIDRFLYAYLQIITRDNKYSIKSVDRIRYMKFDKLFDSYKHFLKKYMNDDRQALVESLYQSAQKFRKIFRPNIINRKVHKEDMLERINEIIYGLHQETIIPFIFYVELSVKDQNERAKLYTIIETFFVRRVITRATTKNYNNLFQDTFISNEINSAEKLVHYFEKRGSVNGIPSDSEIKDAFNSIKINNREAKYVLYMIELERRNNSNSTDMLGFSNYELEHLMPKKWRSNWKDITTDGELSELRDKKLLTLGNLAIISGTLNSSISNSSWIDKLEGKENKDGLRKLGSGIMTHADVIDIDVWNEEEITIRASKLYNEVVKYWPYKL